MGRPHVPAFSPTSPPARALLRVFSMFAWRPPVLMVSARLTDTAQRILVVRPCVKQVVPRSALDIVICSSSLIIFREHVLPPQVLKTTQRTRGEDNRCESYQRCAPSRVRPAD
jgi:hypothetical protein